MEENVMKRIFALVLAMLMLLPVLVACDPGTSGDPEVTTAGGDTTAGGTGNPNEPVETDKPVAEVPEGKLDYEVKVLTRGNDWVAWDIVYDETNSLVVETLNNAIKKRNDAMEEKYGVTIKQITAPGTVKPEAESKLMTGINEYDLILPTIQEAGELAQRGLLIPMSGLEYVDTSKPWYDQRSLEELAIKGENFFVFSDITAVDLDAIWTFFFSHSLIDTYNLEDPYELVANYEWTLDKMIEMCETATPVDPDGVPSKTDDWGIVGHDYIITAAYIGSGEKVASVNTDGEITLTMNNNALRVTNLMESLISLQPYWCRYALTSSAYSSYGSSAPYGFVPGDNYPELVGVFTGGHALFMGEVLSTLREFTDVNMEIGVLPTPMYEASQKAYYCAVNKVAPVLAVPTTCEDTTRISIIIEAWAAESHDTLLPAYYDNCMTTRYAKDAITSDILDMIFASRTYDLGICFGWGNLVERLTSLTYNGSTDFVSMYKANGTQAKTKIDRFMDNFVTD